MSIWSRGRPSSPVRLRWVLWSLCAVLPLLGLGYQVAAKSAAMALAQTPFGPAWFGALVRLPAAQVLLALEVASFAAWMTVLSEMKLSAAFPLTAIAYVLVIGAGWLVFHEAANLTQVVGGAAILAGIWLIGRPAPEPERP